MMGKKLNRLMLFIAAFSVFALPVLAGAQRTQGPITAPREPQGTGSGKGQPPVKPAASARSAAVNVDVLVTDQDGLVLAGLKQENFRIFDDGKLQTITHFEPVGTPITIVMLMEYSQASYGYFASKAADWASMFLNQLKPEDFVALITYHLRPTVQVDFTHNQVEVRQTLAALPPPHFREANMYDALTDTLDRLDRIKGKSAILLIGTGANTMGHNTWDSTLNRVRRSNVTIFCVGVAEAEYLTYGGSAISYMRTKKQLETFSKVSGGMAFFPRLRGEIPGVFRTVATFLRDQYRIGFTPTNVAKDGKYHKLKVEIVRPDGSLLTVINPKGKRRKVIVHAREGYTAAR